MYTTHRTVDLEPARKLLAKHRINKKKYSIEVDGIKLEILPNVFSPAYTNTSTFFVEHIKVFPGEEVLDVFSGSGFVGIKLAKTAKKVTCIDHSKIAIKCIKNNIKLNRLNNTDCYLGDVFDPVVGQKFDVISANPPLLPGQPENILETAILDPELATTKRFIEEIDGYLKPGGRAYLLFSNVSKNTKLGGIKFISRLCRKNNLNISVIAKNPVGYETYFVFQLEKAKKV